jgi:hypothetical protein
MKPKVGGQTTLQAEVTFLPLRSSGLSGRREGELSRRWLENMQSMAKQNGKSNPYIPDWPILKFWLSVMTLVSLYLHVAGSHCVKRTCKGSDWTTQTATSLGHHTQNTERHSSRVEEDIQVRVSQVWNMTYKIWHGQCIRADFIRLQKNVRYGYAVPWPCHILAFWLDEQWSHAMWLGERISSVQLPCCDFQFPLIRKLL